MKFIFYSRGSYIDFVDQDFQKPKEEERLWKRWDFNFDTVGWAMLTLFTSSTGEGWPRLVVKYMYDKYFPLDIIHLPVNSKEYSIYFVFHQDSYYYEHRNGRGKKVQRSQQENNY